MNTIETIEKNKQKIVTELYLWAETFCCEIDDEKESGLCGYDFVVSLAERLEKAQCTEQDYEDIMFHIYQINYNEIKIRL